MRDDVMRRRRTKTLSCPKKKNNRATPETPEKPRVFQPARNGIVPKVKGVKREIPVAAAKKEKLGQTEHQTRQR